MTRLPGDRCLNPTVGWVDTAPSGVAIAPRQPPGGLVASLARARGLTLRLTGLGRDLRQTEDAAVTAWRPDGWPLCPWCGEDELAAVKTIPVTGPRDIDLCYNCGPVEVVG